MNESQPPQARKRFEGRIAHAGCASNGPPSTPAGLSPEAARMMDECVHFAGLRAAGVNKSFTGSVVVDRLFTALSALGALLGTTRPYKSRTMARASIVGLVS